MSLKEVSCVSCIAIDASESWLVKFETGFLFIVSLYWITHFILFASLDCTHAWSEFLRLSVIDNRNTHALLVSLNSFWFVEVFLYIFLFVEYLSLIYQTNQDICIITLDKLWSTEKKFSLLGSLFVYISSIVLIELLVLIVKIDDNLSLNIWHLCYSWFRWGRLVYSSFVLDYNGLK